MKHQSPRPVPSLPNPGDASAPIDCGSDSDSESDMSSPIAFPQLRPPRPVGAPGGMGSYLIDDDHEDKEEDDGSYTEEVTFLRTRHVFDLDSAPVSPVQPATKGLISIPAPHDENAVLGESDEEVVTEIPDDNCETPTSPAVFHPVRIGGMSAATSAYQRGDNPSRSGISHTPIVATATQASAANRTPASPVPASVTVSTQTAQVTATEIDQAVSILMTDIDVEADLIDDFSADGESVDDDVHNEEEDGPFNTDHPVEGEDHFNTPSPASIQSYTIPLLPEDFMEVDVGPIYSRDSSPGMEWQGDSAVEDDTSDVDVPIHASNTHGSALRQPKPVRAQHGPPVFMSEEDEDVWDPTSTYSEQDELEHGSVDDTEAGSNDTAIDIDGSGEVAGSANQRAASIASDDSIEPFFSLVDRLVNPTFKTPVGRVCHKPLQPASAVGRHATDPPKSSRSPSPGPEVQPIQRVPKTSNSSPLPIGAYEPPALGKSADDPEELKSGPDAIHIIIRESLSPTADGRSRTSSPDYSEDSNSSALSEDSEEETVSATEDDDEPSESESIEVSEDEDDAGSISASSVAEDQSTDAESAILSEAEEDEAASDSASSVADAHGSEPETASVSESDEKGEADSDSSSSLVDEAEDGGDSSSARSAESSPLPATPPQPTARIDAPTPLIAPSTYSTPAKRPLAEDTVDTVKPAAQRRRLLTGENMGMLALGAAIGAVGTVAGLMQLAPQ